jgi:hypothetical protein
MHSLFALVPGRALLVLLALAVATAAGCGPQIPKTYPVKGKVVVTGGKLSKKSTIMFTQVADPNVVADGPIADDGTFTVETKMYGKAKGGLPEGEYTVMVCDPQGNSHPQTGQYQFRPIIVEQKARIEPKDNDLTIKAVKPVLNQKQRKG